MFLFVTKVKMNKKSRVALISLLFAFLLMLLKCIVGLLTNSLALLSDALHSLSDIFATFMTYFAVRESSKPPDEEHPFGHHRFENISALFETLFLIGTGIYIIIEAVNRIVSKKVEIEVTVYSYGVVIFSIVIDLWRSSVMRRVAKEERSPALKADAFHFTSDMGTSLVVLIGLISTNLGIKYADSISAFLVALFVLFVSSKLLVNSIYSLTDKVPKGLTSKIREKALNVEGVKDVYDVRVREAGDTHFIDLKVKLSPFLSLKEVKQITEKIRVSINEMFFKGETRIYPEPHSLKEEGIFEFLKKSASTLGLTIHEVYFYESDEGIEISFHLEYDKEKKFGEVFEKYLTLKREVEEKFKGISSFSAHFEPFSDARDYESIERKIEDKIKTLNYPFNKSRVKVKSKEKRVNILIEFPVKGDLTLGEIHNLSEILKKEIHDIIPENSYVLTQAVLEEMFYDGK